MRPITTLLLLAPLCVSLVSPAPAAAQDPVCRGSRTYARLVDLPTGASGALGFAMAERGARFQSTDLIAPGPRLPGRRFAAARRNGCTLAIRYERGGVAHTWHTAVLEWRGGRWVVLRRE